MLANIRVITNGKSSPLCQLDLMKFSQEQVRERMSERDIADHDFRICGIVDWEVDIIMSLKEAYQLVTVIRALYNGDEYIVSQLVKKRYSIRHIVFSAYVFVGRMEQEQEILKDLFYGLDSSRVIDMWYTFKTPANVLKAYEEKGVLMITPKGIYKNVAEC